MSTVDKILIKGIQSFDPENKNVITFFKPLTLIVGPNSADKTTIIECHKLSCTGELPPNSRSDHTFVHDPKEISNLIWFFDILSRYNVAPENDWNKLLLDGLTIGKGDVSPEELFIVIKKRIERILIHTEGGSYQQRVLVEYIKEIQVRAEEIVKGLQGPIV